MNTPDLPQKLHDILSSQLSVYKEIHTLQTELLKDLDSSNQMESIMDSLNKKSALLDKVREGNSGSSGLIDEWILRKEEMLSSPTYVEIERILSEIEKIILELRTQDEAMLKRFDQHSQSQNRINALRGLH